MKCLLLVILAASCAATRAPDRLRFAVDAGHRNYHTIEERYQPFAELLRASGFVVTSSRHAFDAQTLAGADVLVIANATGPDPDRPALAEAEVTAVRKWVEHGGALWLIADHYPFGGASAALARAFGVEMSDGLVGDETHRWAGADDPGNIVFTPGHGLAAHPIVRGRTPAETVHTVVTFVGQSLVAPPGSVAILTLSADAREMMPPDRHVVSAAGRAQGVALVVGRGRVYVSAEAAMFTEQTKPDGTAMGMNAAGNDDRQLAINIARWLTWRL